MTSTEGSSDVCVHGDGLWAGCGFALGSCSLRRLAGWQPRAERFVFGRCVAPVCGERFGIRDKTAVAIVV